MRHKEAKLLDAVLYTIGGSWYLILEPHKGKGVPRMEALPISEKMARQLEASLGLGVVDGLMSN